MSRYRKSAARRFPIVDDRPKVANCGHAIGHLFQWGDQPESFSCAHCDYRGPVPPLVVDCADVVCCEAADVGAIAELLRRLGDAPGHGDVAPANTFYAPGAEPPKGWPR